MPEIETFQTSELLGPYERWMSGPGKFFDLPGLKLDQPGFLTGLVEKQGFVSDLAEPADLDPRRLHLSPLWSGVDARKLSFFPVLLSKKNTVLKDVLRPSSPSRNDGLEELLAGFKASFRVGYPLLEASVNPDFSQGNATLAAEPSTGSKTPLVIMAIIDDGIPFANSNFRSPETDKTRIEYLWDQSAATARQGDILFGKELDANDIDKLIATHQHDEDEIYAAAGALGGGDLPLSSLNNAYSHGGHVLDIMAGNRPQERTPGDVSIEDNTKIIAVSLPGSASWDTSGYGMDMFIVAAFHYIFERADRIAKKYGAENVPLVINLSYGYSGGPHDGSGQIEAAMDELVQLRRDQGKPTALVMPSGNLFMERLYAVIVEKHFEGSNWLTLPWQVPANDRTSSFLEMWFPDVLNLDQLKLRIIGPDGEVMLSEQHMSDAGFRKILKSGETAVGEVTLSQYRGKKWRIVLALAPTEFDGTVSETPDNWGAAASGLWRIEFAKNQPDAPLFHMGGVAGADDVPSGIECWIQRDESFGPFETGAKQSYFDDPLNALFAHDGSPLAVDSVKSEKKALVRRFGSLSGMCTGSTVLRVGGYIKSHKDEPDSARYSSAGPVRYSTAGQRLTTYRPGVHVHCSAPSEESWLQSGIVAAGTRSGSVQVVQGTSAASPFAARCLALAFLRNGAGPLTAHQAEDNYLQLIGQFCDVNWFSQTRNKHYTLRRARVGKGWLLN